MEYVQYVGIGEFIAQRKTDDIKLYVDGIYDGSSALTSYAIITSADTDVLIGKNRDWGGIFAGQIDDVRVYDRELTGAEILVLASEPVPDWEPMIGLSALNFNFLA